jgi:hypothetical protein
VQTQSLVEKRSTFWEYPSRRILKRRLPVLGTFAVLILSLFAAPIHAETAAATARPTPRPRYDISKEVTLTGSVSSVVKQPTRGMHLIPGSHLMVTTSSGTVDASLGRYAMKGKKPLSFTSGEQVRLTGVTQRTSTGKEVFMVRLVQANGHIYKLRNEHGFAYMPAARRDSAKSESKGGSL